MDIQAKKIELAKHLLNVNKESVLDKISEILFEENIITYTSKGKGLTKKQYRKHLEEISKSVSDGTKTYTTEEIKDLILNS